jgi:hypothetical protein
MLNYFRNNLKVYFIYSAVAGLLTFYRFRKTHTLLLFVGYPRSGSSTLGSILDAHKNILIAHELNILKYIQTGFKPYQLFYLLAKNSKLFTRRGRLSSGYRGVIDSQFNGRAKPCLVIGDKKAGATSRMLENNQDLEQKLINFYPRIKIIHIVRNPFDMIASEAYSGNEKQLMVSEDKLSKSIDLYANKFRVIDRLIKESKFDIVTIKHENLLANPESNLEYLLNWLEVDMYDGFTDACKVHLFDSPHKSRLKVSWTSAQLEIVLSLIAKYSFLGEYSFDY